MQGETPLASTTESLRQHMEYPVFVWSTLVRFYRNTQVLELAMAASLIAYGFGLFFGMYINSWSFTQSTYFYSYTISTIGYTYDGATSAPALATLSVYVFCAVLAFSLLLGLFVAAVTDASEASIEFQLREERQETTLDRKRGTVEEALRPRRPLEETRVEARARVELSVAWQTVRNTFFQMLGMVILGVAAVIFFDKGITFNEAVLFVLESVTTVGYGTSSLNTSTAKWFAIIYILPGCLAWARFVAAVSRYPLALRHFKELHDTVGALKTSEGVLDAGAAHALRHNHAIFRQFLSTNDNALDEKSPKTPHSLRAEDFIIQWLLATKQVHLYDIIDAHQLFCDLENHPESASSANAASYLAC
ncbi:hypothetical protein CTAYLR_007651 [Chrysophaeum taylorii]|uniref:Potassium channel domain-containing protein n=1 Tax=Chrysophaeum taylorii TaxID=2483200 RepID=A0AAD7XGI7_9STRA|nr:hypothetical protein CTAYLR_007651 [Chrysophaeum taylorii]